MADTADQWDTLDGHYGRRRRPIYSEMNLDPELELQLHALLRRRGVSIGQSSLQVAAMAGFLQATGSAMMHATAM